MDSTLSVSKGCFIFKKRKSKQKSLKVDLFSNDLWYISYKKLWNAVEEQLEDLHQDTFSKVLHELICYVRSSHDSPETNFQDTVIPTAALLTGINMPDHGALIASLVDQLHQEVTPHVAVLHARKCRTIRATVEQMVAQILNTPVSEMCNSDDDDTGDVMPKSQCNFPALLAWYSNLSSPEKRSPTKSRNKRKATNAVESNAKKPLIIVVPDFENFCFKVLQDFILILSGYRRSLPLVLVLGVATSVTALHRNLPYHVSSCLHVQAFQGPPSSHLLNQALDQVILNINCPFHLGSKSFRFLMDVFLFYDFSVKGFLQGFKFCMMEHFCGQEWKSLCCPKEELKTRLAALSPQDLEQLRALPSFRRFVETRPNAEQALLLLDDAHCKTVIHRLLKELHEHFRTFHVALRCLQALSASLPGAPLGTQMRELYSMAVSSHITTAPEFQECFQLLGFQSRSELLSRLTAVLGLLEDSKSGTLLRKVREQLAIFHSRFEGLEVEPKIDSAVSPTKLGLSGSISRFQLKEKLLALSKQQKPVFEFETTRNELLDYLSMEALPQLLCPPSLLPLVEVLMFDDVASVRTHIVGSPRAAIHIALNDPQFYLECDCCKQPKEGSLLAAMPDLSVAYKLYLECGRFINLYDWLQAFVAVVSPSDQEEEHTEIDSVVQARFTRAVAELQFLGFIKSSNRKLDHVTKLTWGNG